MTHDDKTMLFAFGLMFSLVAFAVACISWPEIWVAYLKRRDRNRFIRQYRRMVRQRKSRCLDAGWMEGQSCECLYCAIGDDK